MLFDWDEGKAQSNLAKHGVAFTLVERFAWDNVIEIIDTRLDYGETRIVAYGEIDGRLHVLVYVPHETALRVISLRKANPREVRLYNDQFRQQSG